MVETWNMIVRYLQCFLEHINCFLVLLCILISQTFAVEEFGISRHQSDSIIEILMSKINLLQS